MAEIKSQLEILAYLAMNADSVCERRRLHKLLRDTETSVDAEEVDETEEVVAA